MGFRSLSQVLDTVQQQYKRRDQRQLQQLLQCWAEAVGPIVATQTRPLTVRRGVLKVATSSAAWAQNLVFERQRILSKLNGLLPSPLTDIHFSPAQWSVSEITVAPGTQQYTRLWHEHPSRLPEGGSLAAGSSEVASPQQAFAAWAQKIRLRSQALPLCPRCHCPTPPGELERWDCCSLCAAKQW